MMLTPNIGPTTRILYVAVGVGLVAAAWLGPFTSRTLALVVAGLGVGAAIEGAVGF